MRFWPWMDKGYGMGARERGLARPENFSRSNKNRGI